MDSREASEWIVFMVCGIIFFCMLVGFIIYFIFFYRQKQLLHIEAEKRLKAEYEKGLAESQVAIQDNVLRHVSSEIHDNLGQIASLLKMQLYSFPMPETIAGQKKLSESRDLLSKLIKDLKALSINLNKDFIVENGLAFALQNEVDRINQTGIVCVHIQIPDERVELGDAKEIFLFRMGQEILNNMLKYAHASDIWVVLHVENGTLHYSFKDNGRGFHVDETLQSGLKKGHSGLHSLQKIAGLMHAELKINSVINKGSEFMITLHL